MVQLVTAAVLPHRRSTALPHGRLQMHSSADDTFSTQRSAVLALACSTLILTSTPAFAVRSLVELHQSVEQAAVEVAQAADPILRSVQRDQVHAAAKVVERSLLKVSSNEL